MVPALMIGFDVIPQSAEEINLPQDQIGKMLILSVCLAVIWYIAITFAVGLSLTAKQLLASGAATADAMSVVWGSRFAGALKGRRDGAEPYGETCRFLRPSVAQVPQ